MLHVILMFLSTALTANTAIALDRGVPAQTLGPITTPLINMKGAFSSLDLSLAVTTNPNAVMFGHGNRISFCPALSCIYGPPDGSVNPAFADHQRASVLISTQTQDDMHSEEQTLAITTTIGTGQLQDYASNKAFALGANIAVGNAVYRATTAGTSGVNSSPPGSRPTSVPFTVVDGTVRWLWINDAAIAAKVGVYNEVKNLPGGGNSWAQANNTELAPGHTPHFNINTEFDFTNHSGTDCEFGINCIGLYVAMSGSNTSTAGINILSGNIDKPGALWGLRLNGAKLAREAAIAIDANSKYGIAANQFGLGGDTFTQAFIYDNSASPKGISITGAKAVAAIEDMSAAPTGISVGGVKSLASIVVSGSAPTGLLLSGSYNQSQIAGAGWRVSPEGVVAGAGFAIGGTVGVSCSGPPTANFQVTNGIVTRC